MTLAYFDCFSGASGDMILGALLDAGLELKTLRQELEKLPISGFSLEAETVHKNGFGATQVKVRVEDLQGERKLSDIEMILHKSSLSPAVCEKSSRVFRRLAEVEATLHQVSVDEVHFHEVGALDAIVDVVGSVAGLELLGVERVVVSPIHLGTGFVQAAHGEMPIPSPATLALVRDAPVYSQGIEAELLTPTGAALLTTLADAFGPLPPLKPRAIGYGAGSRDLPIPNLLRLILGDPWEASKESSVGRVEGLELIEANIDDMNPQFYEYVSERLFAEGALDVYWTAVGMKKGRPGVLLSVLTAPKNREALVKTLLLETTTLGVRWHAVERLAVARREETLQTRFGPVRVKKSWLNGRPCGSAPEYEDCRRIAREQGVPLRDVYEAVQRAVQEAMGD